MNETYQSSFFCPSPPCSPGAEIIYCLGNILGGISPRGSGVVIPLQVFYYLSSMLTQDRKSHILQPGWQSIIDNVPGAQVEK